MLVCGGPAARLAAIIAAAPDAFETASASRPAHSLARQGQCEKYVRSPSQITIQAARARRAACHPLQRPTVQ